MLEFVFGKNESEKSKKKKTKPKSKSPSIRIVPEVQKENLERVYTDLSIKLDSKKAPSFKNSYSIRDFELLAAKGKFQEAYWAAIVLRKMGANIDKEILENVILNIEVHWPELYEDHQKKLAEEAERKWIIDKKKKEAKNKKEEALLATEFLKKSKLIKNDLME